MIQIEKPIILCGFMASGKTTIGKKTAALCNLPFYDTDEMIIRKSGMTINQIFEAYGEAGFRDLEHEVARIISGYPPCIISTGGGLLTFERNGDLLSKNAIIVLLHRDFEATWKYLSSCTDRPLVKSKTKEQIHTLYLERVPKYKRYADFEFPNNDTPDACAHFLIKQAELASSQKFKKL